jgi:hypothetical protein
MQCREATWRSVWRRRSRRQAVVLVRKLRRFVLPIEGTIDQLAGARFAPRHLFRRLRDRPHQLCQSLRSGIVQAPPLGVGDQCSLFVVAQSLAGTTNGHVRITGTSGQLRARTPWGSATWSVGDQRASLTPIGHPAEQIPYDVAPKYPHRATKALGNCALYPSDTSDDRDSPLAVAGSLRCQRCGVGASSWPC